MLRALFRLLSLAATARAARRGPGALAKRQLRRAAHRAVNRELR